MSLHRDENATSLHDVLARHRPRITLAVVLLLLTLLAGTALLGVVVGMGLGSRRTKRKYMNG